MRIIEFQNQGMEVLRYHPTKRVTVIGRSPTCDVVLRGKKIEPVHFLLEWMGEGEFNSEQGLWILLDISGRQREARDSGEGVILQESATNFGRFQVRVTQDNLTQTTIKRGLLTRNIDEHTSHTPGFPVFSGKETATDKLGKSLSAEIVTFSKNLDQIINVEHYLPQTTTSRISPFVDLKNIKFNWNKKHSDIAFIENSGESVNFDLKNIKQPGAAVLRQGEKFEFNQNDFLLMETPQFKYFIRLVPTLHIATDRLRWLKEKTNIFLLLSFLLLLGLSFLIAAIPQVAPEEIPPRFVQIELPKDPVALKKEPPPPVETPTTTSEIVETAPPAPNKPDAPKEVQPKDAVKTPPPPMITKNVEKTLPKKVNTQPAPPAPPKDFRSLGLLGKLKSGQHNVAKMPTMAVAEPVSEKALTDRGSVIREAISEGSSGGGDKSGSKGKLSDASTVISNSTGAKNGAQNKLGSITGTNLNGKNFGSGTEGGNNGLGSGKGIDGQNGSELEVVGGLDKESVRRALRDNQRAIRNCFETGLFKKKDLGGRVVLRWTISAKGPVDNIAIQSSSAGLPSFETCLQNVVKGIVFPRAPNGKQTIVIYPFQFKEKK